MENNKKHMRRCAVCKNRHNYKTFKFFKTPVCPMKRQRWIDACGVIFRDNDLICQNHFAEQDFINGPGCSGIIRLQPGAVPQVRAPTPETSSIEPPVYMKNDAPYKKCSTRTIEKTSREMEQLQFCRICAKCSKSGHSNKLFGDDTQKLIKKIEDITGIRLVNSKPFPQYICKSCEDDLEKAHEFRERCIFSQEYFNTLAFKKGLKETTRKSVSSLTNNELDIKDELPLEECELVEMSNMKEESCDAFFLDGDEFSTINGKCEEEMVNNFTEDGDEVTANTPHTSPIKKEQIPKSKHIAKKQVAQSKTTKIFKTTRSKIAKAARKTGVKSQTFICDQCGNYFTCKHHFVTHLRRHTGDKRHQCELCPDRFFTNSELNRHMRKHTGERPFACKHCGRRFTDYSTRIKHERTHTNERPFVCLQCTKAFTTSYILKNHMLVHTGERSFRCDLCNRSFQRQTHLAVHARSIMHKQNEEKQRQKDNKVPATEHTINEANY